MTAAPRYTFADIKGELLRRLPSLVRELAPDGSSKGGYWIAKNPVRDDRHAGSFWIRLTGSAAGAWKDAAAGESGDVINLIAYILGHGEDKASTYQWCLSWLGWAREGKGPSEAALQAKRKADTYFAAQQQREETAARQANAQKAKAWWLGALPIAGTPVETYLARRGLPLSAFKRLPGAIRYQPPGEWIDRETGEVHARPHTMLTAMCDEKGAIRAVHRTYLTGDGEKTQRADSAAAKMIWPSFAGLVIRLGRAQAKWTPERAAEKGLAFPLLLSEGIEDGLTGHLACAQAFAWAAGTLSNMGNVPLLPAISRIVILGQNDKGPAAAQFEKVVRKLRMQGASVFVARSWVGKDANDLLRGAA